MITRNRWFKAQKKEREYWAQVADSIFSGAINQLDWYEWRAREFEKLVMKYGNNVLTGNPNILEIGSGPIGIINYLDYGSRFSIDPLENYYKTNYSLTKIRDRNVYHLMGTGECLPFKDEKISIVIIDNVIDHTCDPEIVMREIHRVINRNGYIYLSVNVYTNIGEILHEIVASLRIDTKHPHSYTEGKIRNLICRNGFKILNENVEDYNNIRKTNILSPDIKIKIKGYIGLSECIYYALCRKA